MPDISTKPYFIRALHEWCTDSGYTPHIVVQVDNRAQVPRAFVKDGQITLNVGGLATNKLVLGNDFVEFQARFGGRTENISVPVNSVTAIYARETGAGMGFEVEEPTPSQEHVPNQASAESSDTESPDDDKPKRSHLKVVK
jgi:stringent starvation protein B